MMIATAIQEPSVAFEGPARLTKQQLIDAFAAGERLPALRHSHSRVMGLLDDHTARPGEIALAIESDAALAVATLAAHAAAQPGGRAVTADVQSAVDQLPRPVLKTAIRDVAVYDFFDRSSRLTTAAARLRGHGLAVQRTAHAICALREKPASGALTVAALVHDIGKVALSYAYESYSPILDMPSPPGERLRYELSTFGIDHAVIGATCLRRLGLSADLLTAVADHHRPGASEDAVVIALADMLVHYEAGRPVSPDELVRTAVKLGLGAPELRELLSPRPDATPPRVTRAEPCPLAPRQLQILRMLREGMVYKEIAAKLGLSVSTVRSHAHAVYGKLSVIDRSQAVLAASERGWL